MGFPVLKSDSGIKVCVYTTQAGGEFPIHGAYESSLGEWIITAWRADGKWKPGCASAALDLCKAIAEGSIEIQQSKKETER